jgi:hypothetical protein
VTISSPAQVGAIAVCKTGRFEVLAIEGDKAILLHPDGRVRVPVYKVLRFDLPDPRPIQVGDRVRHRQTGQVFIVAELYSHYVGLNSDDERTYEQWAKLTTEDGKPAHWKVQQLEVIG